MGWSKNNPNKSSLAILTSTFFLIQKNDQTEHKHNYGDDQNISWNFGWETKIDNFKMNGRVDNTDAIISPFTIVKSTLACIHGWKYKNYMFSNHPS